MTLKLILIRHAKSDWSHADLSDHDRPLNDRGSAAALRIGAWLCDRGEMPDVALCSTACRTRETWAGIASRLPGAPAPTLVPALYNASDQAILREIRNAHKGTLALLAHNPGIGTLAHDLADGTPEHPKFGFYPTGATTVLRFEVAEWRDIGPGSGRVEAFTVPRDLDQA